MPVHALTFKFIVLISLIATLAIGCASQRRVNDGASANGCIYYEITGVCNFIKFNSTPNIALYLENRTPYCVNNCVEITRHSEDDGISEVCQIVYDAVLRRDGAILCKFTLDPGRYAMKIDSWTHGVSATCSFNISNAVSSNTAAAKNKAMKWLVVRNVFSRDPQFNSISDGINEFSPPKLSCISFSIHEANNESHLVFPDEFKSY